ncbi:zinc finger, CCHC-type containing protein [Tanacetum coccineum]
MVAAAMSVVYVLTTPIPEDGENATVDQIRRRNKWDNDDYVCRGLILKGMSDPLFDIYQNVESGKELWDSLEAKYMAEDASSKKFLVSNFTNYKMTDSRPVMEQYNELLGILGRFTQHKMNMDEAIQVSCIIDKLPPSWKDFKHTLKHNKEELTLVELGSHLRIEESLRAQDSDKPKGNNVVGPQLNIVNNIGKLAFMSTFKLNDSIIWTESRVLGAVVRLPDPKLKTLGERGYECIFVGYAEHSKAFRFYVIEPNDSVSINSIIESMDAIFYENKFSSIPRPSLRISNGTEDIGGLVVPEEVTEKGFKQKSGIYYFDTYALVARISTIRLLIAMTSTHNLIIHQMDVKTAFLKGDLDEEAPKQWHQKFDEVVLSNGYLHNQADKCVDMTKEFLSSRFFMKDMGEADVILGIRIKHKSNGIASYYIEKILKKFNYFDCTPVSTPMDTSEKHNGQAVSQLEYSRVIGCLMYVMTCTRPDIAFAVGKLSRYTSNLGTQHWQAIQRVLKYLKKTMDYRLTYTGYPSVLEGYTDASWISNTEDNSSTSGWVFLFGGGAISWAFKKQTCITGSTIESEFVALAATGKKAEWLKNLLLEIQLWFKHIASISIRCDSVVTLAKAYSQMYNRKSRHLGVRHSMIRELITNGVISIEFVRSRQNLADHLTKGLAKDFVIKSAEGMRLKSN